LGELGARRQTFGTKSNAAFSAAVLKESRMGRVVTFAHLPTKETSAGIDAAPITAGETREMAAEYIRIAARQRWLATAPRRSDCYLFMLDGTGTISAADRQHDFPAQTFAVVYMPAHATLTRGRCWGFSDPQP
jgi:hypothetical protein